MSPPFTCMQKSEEKIFVSPSHEEYEAERREQKLVHAYRDYLTKKGHDVCRLKIVPPGEAKPIFCDLRDKTDNVLIEGRVDRRVAALPLPTLRQVDLEVQRVAAVIGDVHEAQVVAPVVTREIRR